MALSEEMVDSISSKRVSAQTKGGKNYIPAQPRKAINPQKG